MDISIGLPNMIPGVPAGLILDWSRRADSGPFASLGSLDRVVFDNFEPLVTLAAAAAVTKRARLMTTVLLATTRNAGILAKQAASIDALSGGRLTLGLGVGAREDDFRAAPEPFAGRGKRFEEMLAVMTRVWAGEPPVADTGRIGPPPTRAGGPEVLIGGYSERAVRRVARWGNGYIAGGAAPAMARQLYEAAARAWHEAGRPGTPRFVAATYYGLGPNAAEDVSNYLRGYYGARGEQIAAGVPTTPEALKERLKVFADNGVDELMCWPCIPDLGQVDRLAEAIA